MFCKICGIANIKVIGEIESLLTKTQGSLDRRALNSLSKDFPEFANQISSIDEQACKMHFNFHQKVTRQRPPANSTELQPKEGKQSIAEDIGKDEAAILNELLQAQSATFTALTRQMNSALTDPEYDMSAMLIHPETIKLYNDLAASVRLTVRELRELNTAQNGQKDTALDGLKMLAAALRPASPTSASISPEENSDEEMTTKEFD